MSTLLLRLAGPMQSWGTQSRFTERDTGREPSKSGVVGLLCAALGRPREADVSDLAALRMGVRVDRPGSLKVDYHTAGGSHRKGERYGVAQVGGGTRTIESRRYYLADADFLVGLESDDEDLLRRLDAALADPHWPLFLGRRAFVPGEPVRLPDGPPLGPGLRSDPIGKLLREYWPAERYGPRGRPLSGGEREAQLVLDANVDADDADLSPDPDSSYDLLEMRRDVPLSFESANRLFDVRYVRIMTINVPEVSS